MLSNENWKIQPTLINLHPNEYSQELLCYPFAMKLNRYVGSCNTLNVSSNKVCVLNKTENLNQIVFNMTTVINKLKTLTKLISCKCKCRFDGRKCNSNKKRNNEKCWYECKKHNLCEKDYIWNPAIYIYQNGKYLANIMDDLMINCNEIAINKERNSHTTKKQKLFQHILMKKKATCKTQSFYILLDFINYHSIIGSC